MNILAEPFSIPKRGNRDEENEDAVWPSERQEYTESCVRFAVADGATESSYARRWAQLLVRAVGEGVLSPTRLPEEVVTLRSDWRQWMAGLTLPWYAEEKAAQGAFAALVVLDLVAPETAEDSQGRWQATAVGDSCLFQMRGEDILAQFPLDCSAAFNNWPFLLGSLERQGERLGDHLTHRSGTWAPGDVFYLMTDALACWFLREIETAGSPPEILAGPAFIKGSPSFPAWVESLREGRLIRNDDCTLLRISIY